MNQAYGNTRLARGLMMACVIGDATLVLLAMCDSAQPQGGGWVGGAFVAAALATLAASVYAATQGLVFELLLERRWQAVCGGLGGDFVGVRLVPGLGFAFTWRLKAKPIYPKLRSVHGDRMGWTATVTPFAGQNVNDYNERADRFALAFNVPFCTFEIAKNGLISIRAGQMQVPAAFEYQEESW